MQLANNFCASFENITDLLYKFHSLLNFFVAEYSYSLQRDTSLGSETLIELSTLIFTCSLPRNAHAILQTPRLPLLADAVTNKE